MNLMKFYVRYETDFVALGWARDKYLWKMDFLVVVDVVLSMFKISISFRLLLTIQYLILIVRQYVLCLITCFLYFYSRKKAEVAMEGQFLVRQIYDDEITYNLIGAAVEILSKCLLSVIMISMYL